MSKELYGNIEKFKRYMPSHTLKDASYHFNVSYSLVVFYVRKYGLSYKKLKNKKVIDVDSGKIYNCAKDVAKELGCRHKHVINSINRDFRCRGLKLEYYNGV